MEEQIRIQVPYFSQYRDVSDEAWQFRACAIVNLKMVLEYYKNKYPERGIPSNSIEDLITQGVQLNGYIGAGWVHDVIVILARNYGCSAYRQEFRSSDPAFENKFVEEGIAKIWKTVAEGSPVTVSVLPDFGQNTQFHTILIVGIGEDGFYYHDPKSHTIEEGMYQHVTIDRFKQFWRKFAIFIY